MNVQNNKVVVDKDFGMMLNYAVRYAFAKDSYVTTKVISYVEPLLPYLDVTVLSCMERDVRKSGLLTKSKTQWTIFHENISQALRDKNAPTWNY